MRQAVLLPAVFWQCRSGTCKQFLHCWSRPEGSMAAGSLSQYGERPKSDVPLSVSDNLLAPRHEHQHAMLSAGLPKCPQVGTSMNANDCDQLMCNVQITCCDPCRPQWEAAHLTKGTGIRRKWCCAAATASSEGRPCSEHQCIMYLAEAPAVTPALEHQHVGRPRMLLALLLMQASLCTSHAASTLS